MKFCDGFIFLNKNDLINDQSNAGALNEIILRIESNKFSFNLNSCLFILNNFGNDNLDINKAKKNLEVLIFGKKFEKGFWNYLNFFKKSSNSDLNLIDFNAQLYAKCIQYYNEISDFEQFIKDCLEDKGQISLLDYIKTNYIMPSFENLELSNEITNRNTEKYAKLSELIKIKDKNEAYLIVKYYLFMIDNKEKYKLYKKSNAKNCFEKI